jgi:prepilin-type N-terminal cleavage/methylation domain-containing protein
MSNISNQKNAFTLIESLVSVAITAIGFAGVYTLVGTSNTVISNTIDKEKLAFQNIEIIETIGADQANIMQYHGKDLSNCTQLTTATGMDDQLKRLKNWCNKLEGEVGDKRSQDKRVINVERKTVGNSDVFIVSLELNAKNNKKSVFMKRVFYAP